LFIFTFYNHCFTGPKQKFTVWEDVCTALFTPTPVPVQTALNESAIYYVYAWLTQQFNDDLGVAGPVWGPLVIAGNLNYF
jgi:hypothetical protein